VKLKCVSASACDVLAGAAVFVPLTTLFLVKYVGLDRLTNAYGLLSMIKGLATMAGPPIAGVLILVSRWHITHRSRNSHFIRGFYISLSISMCYGLVPEIKNIDN